ncbi:MAG: sulfatase-like hydrolase/transferase [Myxococcota bacterium]
MILSLLVACTGPTDVPPPDTDVPVTHTADTAAPVRPNVLLVLADDLGLDNISVYGLHPQPANTPTIDALAAQGVRFTETWGTPSCSPARAQVLTGRHGRRYGLGNRVDMRPNHPTYALPQAEVTLGELARSVGYSTSFIGKWHLTSYAEGWEQAPAEQGFDWFAISGGNLNVPSTSEETSYFHWERNENGTVAFTDTYATTSQVDDAIARMRDMPEPWLLVLFLNAPHDPFHAPPESLHTLGPVAEDAPIPLRYRATVEAMDTELGRMLDSMPADQRARTTVVFTSDNGTPLPAVTAPFPPGQGKPTLTEGGLRVPLIVAGPGIEPGVSPVFSSLTDLLPTVASTIGADPSTLGADGGPLALDGLDLAPWLADPLAPSARENLYADTFQTYGEPDRVPKQAVKAGSFKLVRTSQGEFLFDLGAFPFDTPARELIGAGEADPAVVDDLRARLDAEIAARPYAY